MSSSSSSTLSSTPSSSSSTPSTSSSQYLTPEFFPPTVLDAKNSPLALLVQTCSSIGRDSQSNKTVNNDKKDSAMAPLNPSKDASSRLKSTPPSDKSSKADERRKSSYHNGSDNKKDHNRSSNSTKTSPNKSCFRAPTTDRLIGIHEKYPNCLYNSYALDRFTPVNEENGDARCKDPFIYSNGIPGKVGTNFPYLDSDYLTKNPFYPLYNSMKLQEAAALQNGYSPSSGLNTYPPFLNFPLSLDPLAAAAVVYSANLAAQVAAATNQRKSSPSSGTHASGSLRRCSGPCKDPFCIGQHTNSTNPSTNGHSPGSQQCTSSGCTQCNVEKTVPLLSSPSTSSVPSTTTGMFYPGCSSVPGSSFCLPPFVPLIVPGSIGSSLLNPSINPSHSQSLVCNWVQGGDYCGKRFSTSEELLLHLHGHTTMSPSQLPPSPIDLVHQKQNQTLPQFNPSALPPLPFPLPNYFGSPGVSRSLNVSRNSPLPSYGLPLLPSHQRSSMSPNGLFPSSRYHPYKSPVTSPGFGHQQNLLPSSFPSLSAYYSPYAVYNQRLNSATAVGP